MTAAQRVPDIDKFGAERVAQSNIKIAVVLSGQMRGQMARARGNTYI